MLDISVEQILKVKPPKQALLFKVLMVVVCIFSAFFVIYAIGILTTAILVVVTFFLFQYYNAEYEYTLVDKSLDVDRIMARSRRKHLGTYDFGKLEMMAPTGHEKLSTYERMNCKVFNYASGYHPEAEYVVFLNHNGEMVRLVLEPDDRILGAIAKINARKVILREKNAIETV